MNFLEIDLRERPNEWSMSKFQCHDYYEVYFLLNGERYFFINDKIFYITAPTVCIIPPFCMHKTEGNAYRRINLNFSHDYLNEQEQIFIKKLEEFNTFSIDNPSFLFNLLEFTSKTSTLDKTISESFLHVLIHILQQTKLTPLETQHHDFSSKNNTNILQIIKYIDTHYNEKFTLQDLCRKFFISKNTLCSQFRNFSRCSIMQYRSFVQINKAKELLALTTKSMDTIAEECGFSDANYFSLIFKKIVGIAPSYYRKMK